DLAILLQSHEVAMPENVLEDSVVTPEPAHGDRGLGAHPVELRALQEVDILLRLKQRRRIHVTAEWCACSNLDDPSRDGFPAQVAGNGNAVVPIFDEVDVPQVIHLDSRARPP